MIPRLDISFPIRRQLTYWFGHEYQSKKGEFLLNHARSGIVMALRAALPHGGRVGVVAYNCDTVFNAVFQAGCQCVFLDVTEDLRIEETGLRNKEPDAVIVTNLFGIHNDIETIRKACPNAFIIVDNAHGYGLPAEGDCTVYSINQGKYPALGEGGILVVGNEEVRGKIEELYSALPGYSAFQFWKLFAVMKAKAYAHAPWLYGWLTKSLKSRKKPKSGKPTPIVIKQMCKGVSRMYGAWLQEMRNEKRDARTERLFMDIVRTENPEQIIVEYRAKGLEVDTHFKHWPQWAAHYGYVVGSCPVAEHLLKELVMMPNYYKKSKA